MEWAQRLQAIAQSGLAWEPRVYDRERYEQVRRVAAEMLTAEDGGDADRVEALFAAEAGHATPKVDVRGVVFRGDALLLVREREGGGWSLPGGSEPTGGEPRPLGYETTASAFFTADALPAPLRFAEATRRELDRRFEHREHPEWPADFD